VFGLIKVEYDSAAHVEAQSRSGFRFAEEQNVDCSDGVKSIDRVVARILK